VAKRKKMRMWFVEEADLRIFDKEDLARALLLKDYLNWRNEMISFLKRLPRYLEGYFPDICLEVERDFDGDPLVLVIKVYAPRRFRVLWEELEKGEGEKEEEKSGEVISEVSEDV